MTFTLISFFIALVLVGILAGKANRNVAGWVLLSFLITPFIAALILYLVNPDAEFKRKKGIAYIIILIAVIGLFIGSICHPIVSLGARALKDYEISESSQKGAVCVISFSEQNWEYVVQVQNNSDYELKRIDFRIVYYDKNGNQIDYSDETSSCSIDANMTKTLKLDIDNDRPRDFGRVMIMITDYSNLSPLYY